MRFSLDLLLSSILPDGLFLMNPQKALMTPNPFTKRPYRKYCMSRSRRSFHRPQKDAKGLYGDPAGPILPFQLHLGHHLLLIWVSSLPVQCSLKAYILESLFEVLNLAFMQIQEELQDCWPDKRDLLSWRLPELHLLGQFPRPCSWQIVYFFGTGVGLPCNISYPFMVVF